MLNISVPWRKVWRDLAGDKFRAGLAALSVAAGVFALGLAFGALAVIRIRLAAVDHLTRPAHLTFRGGVLGQETFAAALVEAAQRKPGVTDAEAEAYLPMRWKLPTDTNWHTGVLVAREDYAVQRIGVVSLLAGAWPAGRTLAVELKSAQYFGLPVGASILIEHGREGQLLPITGQVRKPYVFPPQFGGDATFYATPETATWLTGIEGFNKLRVRLAVDGVSQIDAAAGPVRDWLEGLGFTLAGTGATGVTDEFEAGDTQDILSAILLILVVMGVLSLVLSVFFIINTLNALVAQQVWQIGVMKVVGATSGQVLRLYLATALAYGLLALAAIPPAIIGANFLAGWLIDTMSNSGISADLYWSPEAVALQVGVALIVPVAAALIPALGGARLTPREAMSSYGVGLDFADSSLNRWLPLLCWLPHSLRSLAFNLRNLLRRKTRTALTLTTLTAVSVMFMLTTSTRASLDRALDGLLQRFCYDALVVFTHPYRAAQLVETTAHAPGVAQVEVWERRTAWLTREKFNRGQAANDDEIELGVYGLPPQTQLLLPQVVSGRWLSPADGNAIVFNKGLADDLGIRVGDEVTLTLAGKQSRWQVVGIALSATVGPGDNFAPFDALTREIGSINRGSIVVVESNQHDAAAQAELLNALDSVYSGNHWETAALQSAHEFREQSRAVFDVIAYLLLTMTLLAAGVGGLGLMGTLSLNVLERRREIGVMRALGASTWDIARLFIGEGALLGMLSWAFAIPLSYPGAQLFSNALGLAIFNTPLEFEYPLSGVLTWLVIVVVLAVGASLWPALQAARVSVKEALMYE